MTLCIGALCGFGNAKVVLRYDTMATTATAQAQNAFKVEKLGKRWWAMIAGSISDARELAGVYRKHLAGIEQDLTEDNTLDKLRKAAFEYQERIRNNLSQRLTGFDYPDFLTQSALFPDPIRWAIFNMDAPEVELLLFGAVKDKYSSENRLRLFKYSEGHVWSCDNFVAIGSGTTIAEATLMQRGHSELWSLNRTIYAVYEAHKLGSIAPCVGTEMRMNVGRYDAGIDGIPLAVPINPTWQEAMDKAYEEFGPKEIRDDLAFPADMFFGV
jgi:20S proteasome alpha/beta subunit